MSVTPVILPKLGLTMDEGRLVSWLKREGERVEAGEMLFEVETDKATMEVESPVGGFVRRLLVAAGDEVPVTHVVALITTTPDEPVSGPDGVGAGVGGAPPPANPGQSVARAPSTAATDEERIVASPAARKRARELGIDLVTARPSRGGRVSIEDVEAAGVAGSGAPAPAEAVAGAATGPTGAAREGARGAGGAGGEPGGAAGQGDAAAPDREPLTRMRRAIAERMTRSFRDVPQFTVSRDVDMTAASRLRTDAGVSYADVLISAVARTLRRHPRLTMRYDPDGLVPADGIHVGIAVALDDGLLVPVVRDADGKDVAAIASERAMLQDGARAGRLPMDALVGAAFTISNLGTHAIDRFTALVNPPEAAILAVGRVRDRVVARDGLPVVAPVLTLTLSVDHRVADGAHAAAFLADLADGLEAGTV